MFAAFFINKDLTTTLLVSNKPTAKPQKSSLYDFCSDRSKIKTRINALKLPKELLF